MREYNRIRLNDRMEWLKDKEILERYGLASMSLEPGEELMMDTVFGDCDCDPRFIGPTSRQWELVFRVDDKRFERLVSALRRSEEMAGNTPGGPVHEMGMYWAPAIDPADFERENDAAGFKWELVTPRGRYNIKHK